MIKFATALRLETAEPEAILRRFTRNNLKHPTYRALAELGKAVKTIFSVPLPGLRASPAGHSRGAQRGRELEQRQRLHLLRQGG